MTRIIVVVKGGICQAVYSSDENVEVEVLDKDDQMLEPDGKRLKEMEALSDECEKLKEIY